MPELTKESVGRDIEKVAAKIDLLQKFLGGEPLTELQEELGQLRAELEALPDDAPEENT